MKPPSKRCSGFSRFPTQQRNLRWTERNVCIHRSAQLSWFRTRRLWLSSVRLWVWLCKRLPGVLSKETGCEFQWALHWLQSGKKEHLSPAFIIVPGVIGLTWAMDCTPLSLFNAPSCFDLHPSAPPWSTLASAEQTFGIFRKLWALRSSLLTLHLCAAISWLTCILSGHVNKMTGHHRLQEQITPPHKHLFV